METKVRTNGSATQGGATKVETKKPELSKTTIPPTQAGKEEAKVEIPKAPTIEERRTKKELFDKLLAKHDTIQESKKKVEQFIIGSDENFQTLQLKDAKGNLFNTGNPAVIKDVIDLVKKQIYAQCGQVEDDILKFII